MAPVVVSVALGAPGSIKSRRYGDGYLFRISNSASKDTPTRIHLGYPICRIDHRHRRSEGNAFLRQTPI